jgi:putative SOS response-associated peptidase YedK
MCGRYDNLIARDAYRGLFKAKRLPKSNFPLRYNIAPTDQIPIVRIDPRDGEREVVMARWGLEAEGSSHQCARRDCGQVTFVSRSLCKASLPHTGNRLLPMAAAGGRKAIISLSSKGLRAFAFAGIWEFARLAGEEILSAAMIVGEPNPLVGGIHDRIASDADVRRL